MTSRRRRTEGRGRTRRATSTDWTLVTRSLLASLYPVVADRVVVVVAVASLANLTPPADHHHNPPQVATSTPQATPVLANLLHLATPSPLAIPVPQLQASTPLSPPHLPATTVVVRMALLHLVTGLASPSMVRSPQPLLQAIALAHTPDLSPKVASH